MANKKELKVVEESDKSVDLKTTAKKFSKYINQQYREAVSFSPDPEKMPSISVSKWLKCSEAVQRATELPGLPFGNVSCVYGKPDTGKTTFIQECIASCQKQGVLPILILTEHKFDFNRLQKFMGADPEAVLVFSPESLEQGYSFVEKILRDIRTGNLVLETEEGDEVIDVNEVFIFWDSIGNTLSETETEYEVEEWDKNMGKHAKAIRTLTKRVNFLLSKVRDRAGICFINQSYMSMPTYGPSVETPYGGDGVPYSSALVLRFRRKKDLKMTINGKDTIIGLETKIEVKKNHITHTRPTSEVLTVATGMIPAEKTAYEEYKKLIRNDKKKK